MLTVLSPAKTLDYETPVSIDVKTSPQWMDESAVLAKKLKSKTPKQLVALMGISDNLAELNHERYQLWQNPMPDDATKQAVLAFKGDVYLGLEASAMTRKQLLYAQDHLRILSGLYGLLRPLDAMLPYRLEMGTSLKTRRGKDLYVFWGDRITRSLNDQLAQCGAKYLLNLASNEYFRSVHRKDIAAPIVSPVFKDLSSGDLSSGKFRVISFFAKKARGTMAAWCVRHKVKTTKKLIQFAEDGYEYDTENSTETKPVFLRRESPTAGK